MILNISYTFLTFPMLLPKGLDSCAETYSPQNQFLISIDSSFLSFLLSFVSFFTLSSISKRQLLETGKCLQGHVCFIKKKQKQNCRFRIWLEKKITDSRREVKRTMLLRHFLDFPVVQWIRAHLPVKGSRMQSLVPEISTCHGTTKPMYHNYWAPALEPVSPSYWSLST